MKKLLKRVVICLLIAVFFWCGNLLSHKRQLRENLIRLHVVANSDSEADQAIKLQVRDAVVESLKQDLQSLQNLEEAKAYLQRNLPKIESLANETLKRAGIDGDAVVTLCREAFDKRIYDTFTLPAGVYESLRIIIGQGEGHNWWCVVFPSLCLPATTEGFEDVAAGAGFSEELRHTLTGEEGYQVRFFLLDAMGQLENMFFAG